MDAAVVRRAGTGCGTLSRSFQELRIMKTSRVLLLGFIVLLSTGLFAEEGMWMPQQIPALAAKLRALGFAGIRSRSPI